MSPHLPLPASLNAHLCSLFLLLVITAVSADDCGEYRRIHREHTMCKFEAAACTGKRLLRSGDLSCAERSAIVRLHNELRSRLATGGVEGQPAAQNMREMVWDDELARIAQRWADQCGRGHDKHRHVDRFRVGQNVAVTWTLEHPSPLGDRADFDRLVRAWFDEVAAFNASHIEPFVFSKKLGHYTQMAWADTYLVGCGFTYFWEEVRGFTKMYVCNYGPQGNVIGGEMYQRKNNTFCEGSDGYSKSPEFAGLCRNDTHDYAEACQSTAVKQQAKQQNSSSRDQKDHYEKLIRLNDVFHKEEQKDLVLFIDLKQKAKSLDNADSYFASISRRRGKG